MAIAYVSSTQSSTYTEGTTAPGFYRWHITGTFGADGGNAAFLFVDYSNQATIGSATINGAAITEIATGNIRSPVSAKVTIFAIYGNQGTDLTIHYTADARKNFSTATQGVYSGVYSDEGEAGMVDAYVISNQVTGDPCTVTVTSTLDEEWIVGWAEVEGAYVGAGSDTVVRQDATSRKLFDSDGPRSAGSNSLNLDMTYGTDKANMAAVAIKDAETAFTPKVMFF